MNATTRTCVDGNHTRCGRPRVCGCPCHTPAPSQDPQMVWSEAVWCASCQLPFLPGSNRTRYCSRSCQTAAAYRRGRRKRRQEAVEDSTRAE